MTVRLNARLADIAAHIEKGESVCDVGTDHAFLPIWLAENDISEKIVMSDVSRGSLDKAVTDAREELGDENILDARLGDGLDVLSPGEVDDIVIAGMGGLQILDILTWDISKTLTYRKFIFQPRRDAAVLRKWLLLNGFKITDQTVLPENGRFAEIIEAVNDGAVPKDILFHEKKTSQELFKEDPEAWSKLEYPDEIRDPRGLGADLDYFRDEIKKTDVIIRNIRENASGGEDMLRILDKRKERLTELCRKRSS